MEIGLYILYFLSAITVIGFTTYFLPQLLCAFVWKPQDLKKKYNAKWAFVSGGSQGLGRAISEKLASQGLNVVICALDNDFLKTTTEDLKSKYPNVEFRAVGVNLGQSDHANGKDYMEKIIAATSDIDVQIVFNNAGYLVMRGFIKSEITTHLQNLETNSICHMRVTHHFMKLMKEKNLRGCFVFTSSPTGFFPAPSNVLYASSKAFLIHFASCLACEARSYGIDVLVSNMGPMNTAFYSDTKNVPKIGTLDFFHKIQSTPVECADVLLSSVGRITVRDHSGYTVFNRILLRILDLNLLVPIIAFAAPLTGDFKKNPDLI